MPYNLAHKQGKKEAYNKLDYYSEKGVIVEIKQLQQKRSSLQNRALHLYFKMVSDEFISIGYDFHYTNPFTGEITALPYNKDLFKDYVWRPLQKTLCNKESTTEITTSEINLILESLDIFYVKLGITVKFPNKFDLLVKQLNENEKAH